MVTKTSTTPLLGEDVLRQFMDAATETFSIYDRDLNVMALSRASEIMFGLTEAEAIGRNLLDLAPSVKASGRDKIYRRVIETGEPYSGETWVNRQDGRRMYVTTSAFRVGEDYLGVVTLEITARKDAEEALRQSEARFRDVAEIASDWIWETDADYRITYVSSGVKEFEPPKNVIGHIRGQGAPDLDLAGDHWKAHSADIAARRPFENFEYEGRDDSGAVHRLQISGKPVFAQDGTFAGYRGVGRDITEFRRTEAAVRRSEQLFSSTFHNSPGMSSLIRVSDGSIVDVNAAWCAAMGPAREEAIGRLISDFDIWVTAEDRDVLYEALQRDGRIAGQESRFKAPDGRCIPILVYSEILELDGESYVLTVNYDVTKRKQAEEELRESQGRLSDMLAMAPDAVITVNDGLKIDTFNRGAEDVFGYAAKEVLGQPLDILLPEHLRAEHRKHIDGFSNSREASRRMGRRAQVFGRRKDGSEFPAEASISKLDLPDQTCFTVVLHDVSERMKMENALIAAKEHAEIASQTKSDFLANMSHELRTPLNAILGFSEILQQELFGPIDEPRYLQYAADIYESGDHLLDLINNLLDISKVEAGHIELAVGPINLRAAVNKAFALVRGRAGEHGVLLANDVPEVFTQLEADPRLLRQILTNLCSNAVKFTPSGGQVAVSAAIDGDGWCKIRVADSGVGIPAGDIENILEPFGQAGNRIEGRPEGTGLGLPLVKSFVEVHGGDLTIESAPGTGTTVTVSLPPIRVLAGLRKAS